MIKEEKIKMQIIHDNDTGQGFWNSDQCRFDQSERKKKKLCVPAILCCIKSYEVSQNSFLLCKVGFPVAGGASFKSFIEAR